MRPIPTLKISISGVRGVIGESLTPILLTRFSQAFGTYVGGRTIVIGRDPRSTVWLDDESVSRRHAMISVDDVVARVQDLDSTNGTFLNRAPLKSATALQDGDIVRVGSLKLTFRTLADSAARTRRLRRGSP